MNKQLSLFETQLETYIEETRQDEQDFNVCPKCNVKPIIGKSNLHLTIDGYRTRKHIAQCPICKYTVADLYSIVEHWNNCNRYRVRDGML